MVTFGSYLAPEEHIPTAGFRVTLVDAAVSLVALLLIFPVAFQASGTPVTDPILLFDVIPRFLLGMRGGQIFGIIFFLCLYFAALNATLGLFEALVANMNDVFKNKGRTQATWLSGILVLSLSIGPSLLSRRFESLFHGKSLIEVMDSFLINWILPLVVLGIAMSFSYAVNTEVKEQNFKDAKRIESLVMYSHWIFIIKYVVPLIIGTGFALKILGVVLKIHS
jgi:NSS family neurotransmitter:Na+ symporter